MSFKEKFDLTPYIAWRKLYNLKKPNQLLLIATLFTSFISYAQDGNDFFGYSSIGVQYHRGSGIGNTFKQISNSNPFSAELFFQKQTNVSPTWNSTKRSPQWGIGISATNSGSEQHVGTIVCAYPYLSLPLFTAGPLQGNARFGLGLGWVEKPYNRETNSENHLLSQKINAHANLSFQNELALSPQHFIYAAVNFYHVSNGKTSLPNLGINIPSVSVGYRYAFNGETKKPVLRRDSLEKGLFYRVLLSAGAKKMHESDSSYYFVKLLGTEIVKQISHSSTLAAGIFITHDASLKADPLVKKLRSISTSQAGVYASYEYNFGRFTIPVQLGLFFYNSNSRFVESVGFRYKISEKWLAQFLLKSHHHRADVMHFGVGYQIR